jgi:zinc transport system substrate-binding protein
MFIKNSKFIFSFSLVLMVSFLMVASCSKKQLAENTQKKLTVIASLFPIYDFAKNVGGDKVEVIPLLPPGVEAHSFEPRPADITKINDADIFIYTGKFMEPWVDDLAKSVTNKNLLTVDSSAGVTLIGQSNEFPQEDEHTGHHYAGAADPHIWLDFSNAQKMVNNICVALVKKDSQTKDFYLKNAADYNAKLSELDSEYRTSLAGCKNHTVIYGGHFAFGYMAKRYNLTFISAYKGFTPDSEPTPKNLAELIDKVKRLDVKYIYYEELISPKVAETLSEETGAQLLPLNGAHNVSKTDLAGGVGFISIMKKNLESLKTGLECR